METVAPHPAQARSPEYINSVDSSPSRMAVPFLSTSQSYPDALLLRFRTLVRLVNDLVQGLQRRVPSPQAGDVAVNRGPLPFIAEGRPDLVGEDPPDSRGEVPVEHRDFVRFPRDLQKLLL